MSMRDQPCYRPEIQRFCESVRLALEAAQADYVVVARLREDEGGGSAALVRLLDESALARPAFARPSATGPARSYGSVGRAGFATNGEET